MKKIFFWLCCGLSLTQASPDDNSLVIGMTQEPSVLIGDFLSVIANLAVSEEIGQFAMAPLIQLDLDGKPFPVLATEVPTLENGRAVQEGKALKLKLTLRDDARWSDGTPITTKDIEFYYQVGKAPGMPVGGDYWSRVNLEVQDPHNFTVSFNPGYATDLIANPIGIVPAHLMAPAWQATLEQIKGLTLEKDAEALAEAYRAFFAQFATPAALNSGAMVYSGPFKITRWVAGSGLEMERNPYFPLHPEDQSQYLQKVSYRFYQDTNALLLALMSGQVDATSSAGLDFDQAKSPAFTSRAGNYAIWFVPSALWEHIILNDYPTAPSAHALGLDQAKTRQALLYALDRQGMVEAFFGGLQPVADSWIPQDYPFYSDEITKYPYDPEKARQLLNELGWQPGPDGILTKDGVKFELEVVTTAGRAVRERAQQFMAQNLREVGILLRANNMPAEAIVDAKYMNRGAEGTFMAVMLSQFFSPMTLDGDLYVCQNPLTGEKLLADRDNGYNGANVTGWCNPEFDRLYGQAVTAFDDAQRTEALAEMQKLWTQEVPNLPLYWRSYPYVVRKGLVNYVASTFSGYMGFPSWSTWLLGWEQNGAQAVYDQSRYGSQLEP